MGGKKSNSFAHTSHTNTNRYTWLHQQTKKKKKSSSPNKADMFWKILSNSGVTAGLFSKVTNLYDERMGEGKRAGGKRGEEKECKAGNKTENEGS